MHYVILRGQTSLYKTLYVHTLTYFLLDIDNIIMYSFIVIWPNGSRLVYILENLTVETSITADRDTTTPFFGL